MYFYYPCRFYHGCGRRTYRICLWDGVSVIVKDQENYAESIAVGRIKL